MVHLYFAVAEKNVADKVHEGLLVTLKIAIRVFSDPLEGCKPMTNNEIHYLFC